MAVTDHHVQRAFYITDINGAAQVVIPDAPGDVTVIAAITYAARESGGGSAAGNLTCIPGAAVDLYDDGVDVLTLAIGADGSVTISRTAGAETFDANIHLVWI